MGKKSSSPPPAPDPRIAADAQAAANKEAILTSARVNRVNEFTPWGNLIWERTPTPGAAAPSMQTQPVSMTPTTAFAGPSAEETARAQATMHETDFANWQAANAARAAKPGPTAAPGAGSLDDMESWTRRVELGPSQQRQLDAQNALAEALLGKASTRAGQIGDAPLSFSGMPALSALPGGDFSADRQKVEDALYSRATSRLDPQFEKAQRDQETRLANQGINIGTEAWSRAMDDLNRGRTDAYGAARNDAIAAGGAEQSRMFGQEAQLFGLSMQQRQQMINELLQERSTPWNEIAAILQGSPAMNTPNFSPSAQYQVAPADVMGAINNQSARDMAVWQQGQTNKNATMGSIAGLAGAALGGWLSSKEAKHRHGKIDPEAALDAVRSLPIEAWTYRKGLGDGGTHIGPMAEDFAARFGGDGKTISPMDATGALMASVKALADRLDRFGQH
jgi:hypothetical protein